MSARSKPTRDTLHVRLGHWFEATASGWGILAAALLAGLLLALGVLGAPH